MRIHRILGTALFAGLMGAGGTAAAANTPLMDAGDGDPAAHYPSFQEVDNRNDGILTPGEVRDTEGITWGTLKEEADVGAWKDTEERVSRFEYRSGVTHESPHPRPMGG